MPRPPASDSPTTSRSHRSAPMWRSRGRSCGKRITSSGTRFIRYHASSGDRGLSAPAPLSLSCNCDSRRLRWEGRCSATIRGHAARQRGGRRHRLRHAVRRPASACQRSRARDGAVGAHRRCRPLSRDRTARRARQDVYLRPAPVALPPVTVTGAEDPARRIIAAAIARKHELFGRIHDYRYAASVKFVVRDLAKPPDSAASVLLITETRTAAYWEQPDRYQETILARRQSSNLNAEQNLVTVGEIVNFNRERIDLRRYSLVSPIADDALDYYDYRVLDTLTVEGRPAFRLSLRPKLDASPLFVGVIDIADGTYDLLAIDVGV